MSDEIADTSSTIGGASSGTSTSHHNNQSWSATEHQLFKRLHCGAYIVLTLYCTYKRVLSWEALDAFPQFATRFDIWIKNMLLLTLFTLMSYYTIKRLLSDMFINSSSTLVVVGSSGRGVKNNNYYRQVLVIILLYLSVATYGQVYSNMSGRMKGQLYRMSITYIANLWQMITLLFQLFLGVFYFPIYLITMSTSSISMSSGAVGDGTKHLQTIKKFILFLSVTLCLFGLYHTLSNRISIMEHSVNVVPVGSSAPSRGIPGAGKSGNGNGAGNGENGRYINVIPISDVHLGHSMSVKDLIGLSHEIVNIVNRDPENSLVLFMGDFFTFESEFNVAFEDAIYEGLKPLQSIHQNVYVSLGNHDYDLLERVLYQLEKLHFTVLRDESLILKKKRIQLVGFNFFFKNADQLTKQVTRNAKLESSSSSTSSSSLVSNSNGGGKTLSQAAVDLRLLLLHNPSHFRYAASELVDSNEMIPSITFSGHYHGGQFSGRNFLKSLRIGFVEAILGHPDYEWYGYDSSSESVKHLSYYLNQKPSDPLLYVCSGLGFYGPPLRIGTSSELPIIHIQY